MIMDVDGRAAQERAGKGRWVETKCNNPGNVLVFSNLGLAPASSHQGVISAASIGDSSRRHITAPSSTNDRPTGKKAVPLVHAVDSEEAKRIAGKYGLRKVKQAPREPEKEVQARLNPTAISATSEQRAAMLLSKAISSNPELRSQFSDAIATGGVTLLAAEKAYRRQQEVAQRSEYINAASAAQPPRRYADPANLSKITAPYETNVVGLSNNKPYRAQRRQVEQASRNDIAARGKKHMEAPGGTAETPYDVADGSAPYPTPPACGVRTPLHQLRHGKRCVEAPTDNRDLDSISLQRASHRPTHDGGMPQFIFGEAQKAITPKASPPRHREVGLSMLDHDTKAPVQASRQSRFAEVKYKKTSLW